MSYNMKFTGQSDPLIWEWVRQDWRESIFAPGLSILQAQLSSGATASGLDPTREGALKRCLSETAEIRVLEQMRETGVEEEVRRPQDGIAAHTDPQAAKILAFYEARERLDVSQWWRGGALAKAVPEAWMAAHGFAQKLDLWRDGAGMKRETSVWLIDNKSDVFVAVSRSHSVAHQDPILGFGASACAFEAIEKALRETMLMELNLMEVMAARSGRIDLDVSRIEAKIASYLARCPVLVMSEYAKMPSKRRVVTQVEDVTSGRELPKFEDFTARLAPENRKRSVWGCHLVGERQFETKGAGTAFM